MVREPSEYRLSSYPAHAYGVGGQWLADHACYLALGADHASRQAAYRDLFRHVIAEDDLAAIRNSINRSGVLGIDRFQDEIEAMLNRRVKPGKSGRRRKQTKVHPNRQQMLL